MNVDTAGSWPEPGNVRGREAAPDLAWLASVLWPEADVRLSPAAAPPGRRVAEAYSVLPNARRPRLLVPLSSFRGTDGELHGGDDGLSALGRATHVVTSRVAASSLRRSRTPEVVVYFDREPRPDELLTQHLRRVFDRPDATLVISIGQMASDLVPVVRVVGLEGDVLGDGKVGWSGATRAAVANEAAVLRRWAAAPPRSFTVPDLLYEGLWRQHTVTLTSPTPPARRSVSWGRPPPPEITREIARSGGIALAPLGSTPWWRSVLERAPGGAPFVVLRWMNELHGRRLVWLGSSHGDWTPENMSGAAGRPHVWGWHSARDGVPLGLDPVGFAFRLAMRGGADPPAASRLALRRAASVLRALGVPREDDRLVLACCLAELVVRFYAEPAEAPPADQAIGWAMLEELRRLVAGA